MYTHGQAVTLTDINGTEHKGNLHLPDTVMYSRPHYVGGTRGSHPDPP